MKKSMIVGRGEGDFEAFWYKAEKKNEEIAGGESREFYVGGISNTSGNRPVKRECFMT